MLFSKREKLEMNDVPFEELLKNLDGVVGSLEEGSLTLEKSLAAYEQGVALVRHAQKKLDDMEERLSKLRENGSLSELEVIA